MKNGNIGLLTAKQRFIAEKAEKAGHVYYDLFKIVYNNDVSMKNAIRKLVVLGFIEPDPTDQFKFNYVGRGIAKPKVIQKALDKYTSD